MGWFLNGYVKSVAETPDLTSSEDPFDALNVLVEIWSQKWHAAGVVSTNPRWLYPLVI